MRLCQNNWDYAEEPLTSGGSCLLGYINLSEFVIEPFCKNATFDTNKFKICVRESVITLNQVLDYCLNLHPLQEQKISVDRYRQIGLGVMLIKELVKLYELRNSQLLTIPTTGSISTILGISGGIEPIFKTESLHDEEVYYKVYTPIVKEYMDLKNITDEKDLPDIFVTAMNLDYEGRIKMQQVWQRYIDASISSTINLPQKQQ